MNVFRGFLHQGSECGEMVLDGGIEWTLTKEQQLFQELRELKLMEDRVAVQIHKAQTGEFEIGVIGKELGHETVRIIEHFQNRASFVFPACINSHMVVPFA